MMYIDVMFRRNGVPTEEDIIDAASAGFSSRKDQSAIEISEVTTYEDAVAFLKRVIEWGHTSVLEHIVFKFSLSLSVACAAQFTRHRIASYTQKSYRLKRDDIPFIIPPQVTTPEEMAEWVNDMMEHIRIYNKWIEKGYESDVARFHLPQGAYTHLSVTINARSLRNLFSLRLDSHAMFEFRDLCKRMYQLICIFDLDFLFDDVIHWLTDEERKWLGVWK
jgi:flavin-dependent thymidylate synthase